jgi:hypothetical protein
VLCRAAALSLVCACSFEHGRFPTGAGPSDGGGDAQAVSADAAIDAAVPVFVAAYNIGGLAYTGTEFAGTWDTDPGGVCTGSPWTENIDVTGTVDDPLFQRYRYGGTIDCALGTNLPAATYEITLLFGEVYMGPGCPSPGGTRVFDVSIEGTLVEDNLNTLTAGGCCNPNAPNPGHPFSRVYTREVTDGTVDIALRAESQSQAMISAVMLRRL